MKAQSHPEKVQEGLSNPSVREASSGLLFPVRLRTREFPPEGAHIQLLARCDDGGLYYCKGDQSGLPCRMREAFGTLFAAEVGLAPPDFRIVEDEQTGETFFGSRASPSTADEMARKRFLRTSRLDELGRHLDYPGRWLSQLYVLDMFLHNWDRSADNLIAVRDGPLLRLRPIDFSGIELGSRAVTDFPDGSTETLAVARQLRQVHGFFEDSALQMLDSIAAIPPSVVASFFRELPTEWINAHEMGRIVELWAGESLEMRINLLREGLMNGRLL